MTDFTTAHLECLLEQATPGPWEYKLEDGYIMGDLVEILNGWIQTADGKTVLGTGLEINDEQELRNLALAAAAPQLAREVLRMRGELTDLQEEARAAAKIHATGPTAQRVFDALDTTINQILGDQDE